MSDDLEIAFGPEFDEEEEEVRELLDQYNAIGQITILEHPETGAAAYHVAEFNSIFEGEDGEDSDTQRIFRNICALAEQYLDASNH